MEPTSSDPRRKEEQIQAVIEELRGRSARGESWEIADVLRDHARLQPELEQEIARWRHLTEVALLADSLIEPSPRPALRPTSESRLVRTDSEPVGKLTPTVRDALPSPVAGYRVASIMSQAAHRDVYDAVQLASGRRVVAQVVHASDKPDSTALERFDRDAKKIAELDHPHIIRIIDHGFTPAGEIFFVMPFIDGITLEEWISRHQLAQAPFIQHAARQGAPASSRLPPAGLAQALRLFCQICAPVNAAHLRGVVHGDLTPANIRLDFHGNPSVLGFGLAGLGLSAEPHVIANSDTTQERDARADVFRLGIIFHQMITGSLPDAAGLASLPDDALGAMIRKATHAQPESRYQNAGEMARDVRGFLSAPTPEPVPEETPVKRSNAAVLAIAGAMLIAMIGGACYWFFSSSTSHHDTHDAGAQPLAAPLASHHAGSAHALNAPSTRSSTASP